MRRWTDERGVQHTHFDAVEEITPESLRPVVKDIFGAAGIPVVTEDTLKNAADCADHLDFLTGVYRDHDMVAWLTDGCVYLRELVAAVRLFQEGAA